MAEPRALVLACGTWPSPEMVHALANQFDHVVALDGALDICQQHGLRADVLLGDMDSIEPERRAAFVENGGTVIVRSQQDAHDLAKALAYLKEMGADACTVLGATGGDPQHEWANMLSCAASSLEITCISTDHIYQFLNPNVPYSIAAEPSVEFSLFALPNATDIHLEGVSFPLEGEQLEMGSRGLHNIAIGTSIRLSFGEGRLMLMKPLTTERVEGKSEA